MSSRIPLASLVLSAITFILLLVTAALDPKRDDKVLLWVPYPAMILALVQAMLWLVVAQIIAEKMPFLGTVKNKAAKIALNAKASLVKIVMVIVTLCLAAMAITIAVRAGHYHTSVAKEFLGIAATAGAITLVNLVLAVLYYFMPKGDL